MAANLKPETTDEALEDRISRVLVGAVDMHCHSGPSVMPRDINHIEAMQEAAAAGFRAMLIKDHYYSATPITEMLNQALRAFEGHAVFRRAAQQRGGRVQQARGRSRHRARREARVAADFLVEEPLRFAPTASRPASRTRPRR